MVWNVVIWSVLAGTCWIVGKRTIPEVIELFAEYLHEELNESRRRVFQFRRAS